MTSTAAPAAYMGGTFDPVHNGHLRVALDAAEALRCDVNLLPCHLPPHEKSPLLNADERVRLLNLATEFEPRLRVDTRELERQSISYTVDTLTELRAEQGTAALIWIMGFDSFASLPSWSRWKQLFELAHLLVCQRPGEQRPLPSEVAEQLHKREVEQPSDFVGPAGRICRFTPTQLDISATNLRQRLKSGQSLRYLMPEAALNELQRLVSEP